MPSAEIALEMAWALPAVTWRLASLKASPVNSGSLVEMRVDGSEPDFQLPQRLGVAKLAP